MHSVQVVDALARVLSAAPWDEIPGFLEEWDSVADEVVPVLLTATLHVAKALVAARLPLGDMWLSGNPGWVCGQWTIEHCYLDMRQREGDGVHYLLRYYENSIVYTVADSLDEAVAVTALICLLRSLSHV